MGRRREARISTVLPVRIWGMDANGKAFNLMVQTVDISRTGGRIGGVTCPIRPGEIVGVQRGPDKARFRVTWVGESGSAHERQIGICCVEPAKYIWGVAMPQSSKDTYEPPRPGAGLQPVALPALQPLEGRRSSQRFRCNAGVQLENVAEKVRLWAECTDVSREGCYVETWSPFPAGTEIEFLLTFNELRVRGRGTVRTVHPALGMGIAFTQMEGQDSERLCQIISRFEEEERAPVPPAGAGDAFTERLQRFTAELRDVEAQLAACPVDARVLHEFRISIDNARQTAWAVQQFLELQQRRRDPFNVLSLITAERVYTAIRLCRDLITDIEATEVTYHTEGISELLQQVERLYRQLEQMFGSAARAS